MKNYQVTEIELYLSEVGDGDPDLQFTPQEEYVMHQRCLGRWTAYNEDDLRNRIFDFIGYHAEHLKYEVRSNGQMSPLNCPHSIEQN